ncbi:MAG: ABC transporter permease subunit [Ureaplasma sp.]|nr:ABC transporter permease subunit [Ureaplasma sp.]MDE7222137.1 ABC transporter permease subunit [Ureaplasma sp.]
MKSTHNNQIKWQIFSNKIVQWLGIIVLWLTAIMFIVLFIFIIIKSVPGLQEYTFKGIFLTDQFNTTDPSKHQVSVWLPLLITILIAIGALLIATPLALKTTTFIFFRIKNKKIKKICKIIIEISAAIPSVIFGLFAYRSLGVAVKTVFHTTLANNLLTTIFMISLMIIPTITLLSLNAYNSVENDLVMNSMSLGNSKTKAIYKIFRKQTKKQIIVAIIIAAGRVIGETMAVSMILSSENYNEVFNNGFIAILTSSLRPLGAVISKGMFAENGGEAFRGLLFAFGIIMLLFVLILNLFVSIVTNEKYTYKFQKINLFLNKIGELILYIPNQMWKLFTIGKEKKQTLTLENLQTEKSKYIIEWTKNNKLNKIYDYYKLWWESVDVVIVFSAIGWIVLDVIINGLYSCSLPTSTIFMYSKNTTGQAFINTLLLILLTIIICFPVSLLIAIILNEYAKDGIIKRSMLFFIDCIGATPSIIFGMFGLILFIETFQITPGGAMGNSLLAGSLTMVLVVLPTFTRMNQQALQSVPQTIKLSGYSLGNSKWYVIRTLVLPHAYQGLLSSIVLTIGRILAETAPLYITAGLSSASTIALMNPSQTLTTRIYAQLNGSNSINSINIMYESAFIALLLILMIILISYLIIPNWNDIKNSIKEKFQIAKMLWSQRKHDLNLEKYKTQIIGKTLYLTEEQATKINVNDKYLWRYKDEFINTQIISENKMLKMQRNFRYMSNLK